MLHQTLQLFLHYTVFVLIMIVFVTIYQFIVNKNLNIGSNIFFSMVHMFGIYTINYGHFAQGMLIILVNAIFGGIIYITLFNIKKGVRHHEKS